MDLHASAMVDTSSYDITFILLKIPLFTLIINAGLLLPYTYTVVWYIATQFKLNYL